MSRAFAFDRSWRFDVPVDRLWTAFAATDEYPAWWSWLEGFDADGLVEGTEAACVIRAPLPYSLRLRIHLERVVDRRLVEARVDGDLEGPARLDVAEGAAGGSSARLTWVLEPRERVLRHAARWGRPMLVWAHDRVVDLGVEQFRRRALDGR